MPATDYQSRSFLNLRSSGQVHSMESHPQEQELQSFQRHVADRFHDLSAVNPDELLSISWIRNLLDAFLSCQEDFRVLILNNKEFLNKPPMEKMASEYFDRSVKALDVCNAIRDGIEQIRLWQKQLEIVLCALDNRKSNLGEGHFRRAKKALVDLAIGMLDEKESTSALAAHRNRSFGRNKDSSSNGKNSLSQFRSLSWSVSRSWSANKQLQAIGTNLTPPKSNEILATNGLAVSFYTMNSVLLFVMWAIVAAIPCQDRGLQTHFNIPKQFNWAGPILSLHERILEESKKKDRKNACGLMKEIHEIEICAQHMNELTDSVTFPLSKEKEEDVKQKVGEVRVVFEGLKEGLDPLEKQMREVFHRIVRSRTEGLDSFGRR